MAIGIRGFAGIIGVAALMVIGVACGNGAEPTSLSDEVPTPAPPTAGGTTPTESTPPTALIVSHGGPVKDYVSLVDNLRAAGATVDPAGTESADFLAPEKQLLTVNGEDIQAFEFGSAEEADAGAEGVSASGSSIVTTFADGTGMASMVDWVVPPHFYKAGKLIVIYVGSDNDVIDALQEAMGPQFAGGESLPPAPGVQPVPPVASFSGPPLRLTLDGVEYAAVEWLGAASPNGPIVCCGTPINMDDMEVVGTGTRNTDGDASVSVEVYRPKAGATTDVYIFHPATIVEDREPGGPPPSPAQPASWTRWTDDIAPPAPAANPTHGSSPPPVLSGSPEPSLKFDGVDYVHSGSAGLPSGESTAFVIGGIEVNVNDLAVVGTTFEGRTGGLKDGLQVYRSSGLVVPGSGANAVYTFTPGESHVNPEDGQILEFPATWTRWIAN